MRTPAFSAALVCAITLYGATALPVGAQTLPDCLTSNLDADRHLFTLKNPAPSQPNQQCLLHVSAASGEPATQVRPGRYIINLSDGGDGGAGGTLQDTLSGGGGGGGGGASARELMRIVDLKEGVYKLTIGAGGPGGTPCISTPGVVFSGGPGWLGSPSSLINIASGEVLIGTPAADRYARPSKRENEKRAGNPDGHGGSGPGKSRGGDGGRLDVTGFQADTPNPGASRAGNAGGDAGTIEKDRRSVGGGGGGGASTLAEGGDGGSELARHWVLPPEKGSLGSGGGGGEGTPFVCSAGAPGGNGFIALRRADARSADASDQRSAWSPVRVIR